MVESQSTQPNPRVARGQAGTQLYVESVRKGPVFARRGAGAILALLAPFIAALIQYALWPITRPFAWLLFYPAVFFSSWLGGVRIGVAATFISALTVWWAFVPPQHTFAKEEPRYVISAAVFISMGILFSLLSGRLRAATQQTSDALKRVLQVNRANRALSKCNQALIRAVEESTLLQQICDIVVQDAGYPLCWVGHAEHDDAKSVRVIAQAGGETGYLNSLNITWADSERGQGPAGRCIRTREIVAVRDIASDPEMAPWRTAALKYGFASSLAIPLITESEVFGVFCVYSAETDAFGTEEIQLMTELASDLAFGITALRTRADRTRADEDLRTLNAELEQRVHARTEELRQAREREFEIGNRIQQTLLLDQPPTHVSGLRIAALSLPSQRIDGDFYVFIEHGEDSLDVIVGDVMGKGVPAALLGAATKTQFLKALSRLTAFSPKGRLPKPSEIVMRAHAEIVYQLIDLESFVTLCYARINAGKRLFELVDCGHTGVIHLHTRTGKTDLLHGNNLPLGVRENENYEQIAVTFEPGDLLIFFSDGISEARNSAGEQFGTDRLQEHIRDQQRLEPPMLVDSVHRAIIAFCGTDRLADDLTLVAVCVEKAEPSLARAKLGMQSDLQQLHRVREFVRSFCSKLSPSLLEESSISALELAVDEAASNIMRHAYCGRCDQPIDLEAVAYKERVEIRLYHRGRPFNPSPQPPTLDRSRESGFGLYILSQSVDEVRYCRDQRDRNCIALVKLLNKSCQE